MHVASYNNYDVHSYKIMTDNTKPAATHCNPTYGLTIKEDLMQSESETS